MQTFETGGGADNRAKQGTEFRNGDQLNFSPERLSENVIPHSELERHRELGDIRADIDRIHTPEVKRPDSVETVGRAGVAVAFFRQAEVETADAQPEESTGGATILQFTPHVCP